MDTLRTLDAALRELAVSPALQYFHRRAVADVLAVSNDPRDECEAMDRYRELLDWEPQDEENLAQLRHNYALLLFKHDYDVEAGRMWRLAYDARRHDSVIRRVYSGYLLQAKNSDAAMRVIRGEELNDIDSDPEANTLYFESPKSHPLPEEGRSFCADLLQPQESSPTLAATSALPVPDPHAP